MVGDSARDDHCRPPVAATLTIAAVGTFGAGAGGAQACYA